MDWLFEFILELVLESGIEASKNKKISKFIRYPIIFIITFFYLSIIGLIIVVGISILKDTILGGISLILIGLLIFIISFIKFKKLAIKH